MLLVKPIALFQFTQDVSCNTFVVSQLVAYSKAVLLQSALTTHGKGIRRNQSVGWYCDVRAPIAISILCPESYNRI